MLQSLGWSILFFVFSACNKPKEQDFVETLTELKKDGSNWVSERRYEKENFNLYFQAPDGFYLQKGENEAAVKKALDTISDSNESLKLGVQESYTAFWVFDKNPEEGSSEINASLSAKAMAHQLIGKTAIDAMILIKSEYEQLGNFVFVDEPEEREINGLEWACQVVRYTHPETGLKWEQRLYIQLNKGHVLTYGITHLDSVNEEKILLLENAIGAL